MAQNEPMTEAANVAILRAARRGQLFLSPVTAWEIGTLSRRGRIHFHLPSGDWVRQLFANPWIRLAELTPQIAVDSSFLTEIPHGDPADRMLAATAIAMHLTLVTRDRKLIDFGEQGHLRVLFC